MDLRPAPPPKGAMVGLDAGLRLGPPPPMVWSGSRPPPCGVLGPWHEACFFGFRHLFSFEGGPPLWAAGASTRGSTTPFRGGSGGGQAEAEAKMTIPWGGWRCLGRPEAHYIYTHTYETKLKLEKQVGAGVLLE